MILKKTVEFLGKSYSTLEFHEVNGAVIAECGYPYKPSKKGVLIDTKAVAALGAEMAGVPIEVIDMLGSKDWMAMSREVLGFFGDTDPDAAKPS